MGFAMNGCGTWRSKNTRFFAAAAHLDGVTMTSRWLGLSRCSIGSRRRKQNATIGYFSSMGTAVTSRLHSSSTAMPTEYYSQCFRLTPLRASSHSTLVCTHLWQPRTVRSSPIYSTAIKDCSICAKVISYAYFGRHIHLLSQLLIY